MESSTFLGSIVRVERDKGLLAVPSAPRCHDGRRACCIVATGCVGWDGTQAGAAEGDSCGPALVWGEEKIKGGRKEPPGKRWQKMCFPVVHDVVSFQQTMN